jgi:transposase
MRHWGVDLSRDSFTTCVLDEDDQPHWATFSLTTEGLGSFRAQLETDDRIAVEAGRNSYYFVDQVRSAVAEVVLVNPRQFVLIATSTKKTDRQDALLLARFLKLGCLPTVVMPELRIRELRQLFTAREGLVKIAHQLKNAGQAVLARNGLPGRRSDFATERGRERLTQLTGLSPSDRLILDMVLRQVETVEEEETKLEQAIIRLGRNLPGLKRLLQVRGFGLVAAIGVLAEIGDIHRFATAKQLVAYAGLATSVRQSGATDHHGHITKEGRPRLRGFLVEAVLSMLRNPPKQSPLAEFYQRKKQEKGAGKAICASARKLLTTLFVLLTKELDYWYLEDRLYQKKLIALEKAA